MRVTGWVLVLAADGAGCTKLMADVRRGLGDVGCQNSFTKPTKLRDERVSRGVERRSEGCCLPLPVF